MKYYLRKLFVFLVLFFCVILVNCAELKVTPEHPFYLEGKWISAKDLSVGDELQTIDGKTVRINNITFVEPENPFYVYNLEVPFFNNFIVDLGLVVHNSNLADSYIPLFDDDVKVLTNEFSTLFDSGDVVGIKKLSSGEFKDVIMIDPKKANLDDFPTIKKILEKKGIEDSFVIKIVNGDAKTLDSVVDFDRLLKEIDNAEKLNQYGDLVPRRYAFGSGELKSDGLINKAVIVEEYAGDSSDYLKVVLDDALSKRNSRAESFAITYNKEISRQMALMDDVFEKAGIVWKDAHPENFLVKMTYKNKIVTVEDIINNRNININDVSIKLKVAETDYMQYYEPGVGGMINTQVQGMYADLDLIGG